MKELKPVGGLAKTLIVFLCIYIFCLACHSMTSIFELIELALYDGGNIQEAILLSQSLSALISLVFLFIYIATGVLFLKWKYRLSKNLHVKAAGNWEHSPGGSIGWYFVPVATWFKPYQVMREIWSKAHKKTWKGNCRLLPGWWILWIISSIFAQVLWRINADTVSEMQRMALIQVVSDGIDIALGFTTIALISNMTQAYETNFKFVSEDEDAETATSDYQQNLQALEGPVV